MLNISVVIPTKNRPGFLERAVNSVINQTIDVYEVIVVDDCSDLVDYEFLTDDRIKLIQNTQSVGGAKSRNIGVNSAKGDVIMFLDDDDAWEPNKVLSQMLYFDDPNVSLVFSGKKVVWDNDLNSPFREITVNKMKYKTSDIWECNYIGSTSSVALRRKDFIEVSGFDINLPCFQDYDLWIRLLQIRGGSAIFDGNTNIIYTVFKKEGMQISRAIDGRHVKAGEYLLAKYSLIMSDKERHLFKVNIYQLISKSLNHSNPIQSLKYSSKSLIIKPSFRGLKFFIASIASILGYKHG